MPRIWYVHKFYRREYVGSIRIKGTFEIADQFAAKLNRIYGAIGWGYEISDRAEPAVAKVHQ